MQPALTLSPPLPVSHKIKLALANRGFVLLAIGAVFAMTIRNVCYRVSYTGDEAFYSTMAVNMLHSPAYILRPSFFPDGDFLAERGGFAHPPLNSYFYALSLWVSHGAFPSEELVNVLAFAFLLYSTYRLLALFDPLAGRLAVLLLAVSPRMLFCYSFLEAEPLLTTFGIMALYFVLRGGFEPGQKHWLFIGALCIGVSFELKLWLCGPLALAVATALGIRAWEARVALSGKLLTLFLFGLVSLLPAAAHLLAIAAVYPEDLAFWVKDVYFGVFTGSEGSGAKLSGAGIAPGWVHPFWYYAPLIYRDHFFLIPIFALGLGSVLSDKTVNRRLLRILLAGLAGLLPLSLFRVKEFLYILTCVTLLYLLAAACLAALVRRLASQEGIDPLSRKFGVAVIAGLLLLVPVAYAMHIHPEKITPTFVVAHSFVLGFVLALLWWSGRRHTLPLERILCAGCATFVTGAFIFHVVTWKPQDKTIADIVQASVQPNRPQVLSLVSSHFRVHQFLTFRKGCYWDEVPMADGPEKVLAEPKFATVRAFIVDLNEEKDKEMAPWLRWLETHAVEKTSELNSRLGAPSGFRLFVRSVPD
jgi:4-amino-4-deoxy-L-arabinose transferase-like glycosyltransferase